ncbi:MAG: helix-turn-helix domain-containing protein [Methanothrix sp.]|nr:winged helix-turn-helix domain-containing protein [Methanothrix sp.]MCX8207500.1 helix-turn-helix domain-containing protein [Methanothrix sp.]
MREDAKNPKLNHTDVSSAEAKWWESAEDHKFALEVLQLPLRRKMLRFIGLEARSRDEIEKEFGLSTEQARYHLAMLEKGLVVERVGESYRATITGKLYLENVDAPIETMPLKKGPSQPRA